MFRVFPAALIAAILAISLAACGRETATPSAPTPLVRPVVTLAVKDGTVLIPRALIVERNGLPGVLVLTADNIARFRLVRTGHVRDGRVEIVSGLRGDETLVADNLGDVRDGSIIASVKSDK